MLTAQIPGKNAEQNVTPGCHCRDTENLLASNNNYVSVLIISVCVVQMFIVIVYMSIAFRY